MLVLDVLYQAGLLARRVVLHAPPGPGGIVLALEATARREDGDHTLAIFHLPLLRRGVPPERFQRSIIRWIAVERPGRRVRCGTGEPTPAAVRCAMNNDERPRAAHGHADVGRRVRGEEPLVEVVQPTRREAGVGNAHSRTRPGSAPPELTRRVVPRELHRQRTAGELHVDLGLGDERAAADMNRIGAPVRAVVVVSARGLVTRLIRSAVAGSVRAVADLVGAGGARGRAAVYGSHTVVGTLTVAVPTIRTAHCGPVGEALDDPAGLWMAGTPSELHGVELDVAARRLRARVDWGQQDRPNECGNKWE
ncbi:MAG: hypothetical protein M5U28_36470 [Sandaracinaceae bacterium]|nr:hypothetical protein [Sandaracinaceae bacterium]